MSLKLEDVHGRKYETQGKGPPGSRERGRSLTMSPGPVSLGIPLTRLLREIAATIDVVLTITWTTFASQLGYTEDDIGTSITEPTSKIFKLLQHNAAQFNGNVDEWWQRFLECLNGYGNADLTSQVQEVYDRWKGSQMQPNSQSFEKVYPALQSDMFSFGDEFNQTNQDNDIVPDRPEISMEINVVAEALDKVSSNPRTGDIAKWLRDGVPRIIQIERELKSQKALRGIFEKETHDLKDQLHKKEAELEVSKNECLNLHVENEELKKVKQDDLNEFDFVTRKEAQDIKEEEKVQKREDQRSALDESSPEALKAEISKANRDNAHLKKQIAEIVKVNHSWDEHYKKMKAQYEKQTIGLRKEIDILLAVRSENDQLKEELTKLQQAISEDQKKNDILLLQAKERIDTLEKDNADKQEDIVMYKTRFDRVQGYARTLTSQRKDAEAEIGRLNEALAQKMTISSSSQRGTVEIQKSQTSPILSANAPPVIPPSMESLLAISLERPPPTKRIESMSENELKEELEVLRQQTDVYRSDFEHERQDRQRIMGELDETKKELKKYQRELKAPKPQVIRSKQRQLLEDEQYAQQLQREEDALRQQQQQGVYPYKPSTQKRVQPRYQTPQYQYQRPGQPGYKDYYTVQDIQNIQMPTKGLVPHGGAGGRGQEYYRGPPNYAANDMWIDGTDGRLEIDGEDETDGNKPDDNSSQGTNDDNSCPRCKRSFSHDDEFAVHLDRCVTD